MFIEVEGLDLPATIPASELGGLVPLAESQWPQWVIAAITEAFKDIVPDPLNQKLVEPGCWAFGGREHGLSEVDWAVVVDYFLYEAARRRGDHDEAQALQHEAQDKYGHGWCGSSAYDGF